jgi:hypothetical protein
MDPNPCIGKRRRRERGWPTAADRNGYCTVGAANKTTGYGITHIQGDNLE